MFEEDEFDQRPVVLDIGSHTCKVGIGGEDWPREYIPSVVAYRETDFDGKIVPKFGKDSFDREAAGLKH